MEQVNQSKTELFNYDFSSIGEIFDRCNDLKKLLVNTDEEESVFSLISDIKNWYKGLKKDWTPKMTQKQKDVMRAKWDEFERVVSGKKKYFKRVANRGMYDEEELDEFNTSCIQHIDECKTYRQWSIWFEERVSNMFGNGDQWIQSNTKKSSQGIKCYHKCQTEAKKHFRVFEFAPKPEVSLDDFKTYFPQWFADARQFKPEDNHHQYEYFCNKAVERLNEVFGRNWTAYDRNYYPSATLALYLARVTAAKELLSDEEVAEMFPQPEKHFDTYDGCKKHFVTFVCGVCRGSKIDSKDRLDCLIRFTMHRDMYRYYSENEEHPEYATDLYDASLKEGLKILDELTNNSVPF